MGAKKGNKNALGHDGSGTGRPSAYQERANAEELARMFYEEITDEDKKKKMSGKRSLRDVWVSKGHDGDVTVLSNIFKKLWPDRFDATSKDEKIAPFFMAASIMEKNEITSNTGHSSQGQTPVSSSESGEKMG